MPNLGRVVFNVNYVVDLDDKDMVAEAKQCVFEDVMNAVKYDEVPDHIDIIADPTAKAEDIPEFLLHKEEDDGQTGPT